MKVSLLLLILFSVNALAWKSAGDEEVSKEPHGSALPARDSEATPKRKYEDKKEAEPRRPRYESPTTPRILLDTVDYCLPIKKRSPASAMAPKGLLGGSRKFFNFSFSDGRLSGMWDYDYPSDNGEEKSQRHFGTFQIDLKEQEVLLRGSSGPRPGTREKFYLNPEAALAKLEEISDAQLYVAELARSFPEYAQFKEDLRCLEQEIAKAAIAARRYLREQ